MLNPSGVKIWRPRQLYIGPSQRDYVDLEDRRPKSGSRAFDAPSQVSHGGDSKRNKLATYKNEKGEIVKSKL